MAKIDRVQEVAIEKLKPYEKNAKLHSPEQVEKIAKSIEEFGFLSPCLIDDEYNLIAGHGRVEASKRLGLKEVPCIFIDGLTEAQRKAYILADNRLTELGDWDAELVSSELEELRGIGFDIGLTGFDIDDIIIDEEMGAEITEEEVEELASGEPRIKLGQIWQLGEHRLMCGDATSSNDVERLLGGAQADLLITDPPYNVAYEGGTEEHLTIENDNMGDEEFYNFLLKAFKNAYRVMKNGAGAYVWYASIESANFMIAMRDAGIIPRQEIVWVKNSMILGRQDYQWRHEPCIYGWKDGAAHYFIDVRSFTTVFDNTDTLNREQLIAALKDMATTTMYEKKPLRNEIHPTMKPVPLIKKLIRNSSREGEKVLDLFGGSGTTLIACEEMERKCYMMEYDPKYANAIIQRWENTTGKEAVLIE